MCKDIHDSVLNLSVWRLCPGLDDKCRLQGTGQEVDALTLLGCSLLSSDVEALIGDQGLIFDFPTWMELFPEHNFRSENNQLSKQLKTLGSESLVR